MARSHWWNVLVPVVLVACVPARSSTGPAYDSQLITEDEIVRSHATSAFDAIQKLRANFLSNRGPTTIAARSSPYPTVYVDEQIYGDISILRSIPAEVVSTIRLYRSWEATTRYGTGNMGGVIAVTTRQGGDQAAAYHSRS